MYVTQRIAKYTVINLHRFASSTSSTSSLQAVARNVQAAEIFRSSFLEGSRSSERISPSDLDDLIISRKARPSILIGFYQAGGLVLGNVAKLAPKVVAESIHTVVHDVTIQQFNDGIRDIQQCGDPTNFADLEMKETVKYHRDLELRTRSASPSDSNSTHVNTDMNMINVSLGTVLYNILKISKTL